MIEDEEEAIDRLAQVARPAIDQPLAVVWERTLSAAGFSKDRVVHLVSASRPAIAFSFDDATPGSTSWLGGDPVLPTGTPAPSYDGRALPAIAQIDLAMLGHVGRELGLPAVGALAFFYDAEQQPWGFEPKDRGAARVLRVDLAQPAEAAHGRPLVARSVDTMPGPAALAWEPLGLSDEEHGRLYLASRAIGRVTDPVLADRRFDRVAQVGGHPAPVQGPMEIECEVVARRGVSFGQPSPEVDAVLEDAFRDAGDWQLLLQLESTDDGPLPMWGDMGRLYFWMRRADIAAGRWDDAWCLLQCG